MRRAQVERKTRETRIWLELALDGQGQAQINTGIGFLDHMLHHVAVHGLFDLSLSADGDLHVDYHHTVEDCALVLGEAFAEALGDRAGIARIGSAYVPMDEALALVVVDFAGRPYAVVDANWHGSSVGGLATSLLAHFLSRLPLRRAAICMGRSCMVVIIITRLKPCSKPSAGRWTWLHEWTRAEEKRFPAPRE